MDNLKFGKDALDEKFQKLEEGKIYTREQMIGLGISDKEINKALYDGDIFEIAVNRFKLLL